MDNKKTDKSQYPPKDIFLQNSPLLEAWLEIQWKLSNTDIPDYQIDPYYPFALGIFYSEVKNEFGYKQDLPISKAPEVLLLPYVPQHQFRTEKDGWPLLQLGPGVATVNFTKNYTWPTFREKALYLQHKLIEAYKDGKLETQALILRYRNEYPFQYSKENFFEFLEKKLNISLTTPNNIPGAVTSNPHPTSTRIILKYSIDKPQGVAQIQIGTGKKGVIDGTGKIVGENEIIIWEMEIASINESVVDIKDTDKFEEWLNLAHESLHGWFFSLIDGELFNEFYKGEK